MKNLREVAERFYYASRHADSTDGIKFIESVLKEVVAENRKLYDHITIDEAEMICEKKVKEALEEAARVAEELSWKEHGDDNCLEIATKIRALMGGG